MAARGRYATQPAGFGDDGTGAPFCVPRGETIRVFVWNPINGASRPLASTMSEFWIGWNNGTITT
ncbi:hypothetical protein [Dactylosporangium sp. NPDC005555]|uniref:hypothetical protein n=1 Tax=Dactylosporangium sp. NPDC005555 TaxID=3154889 RepID=UPI0033ACC2ED